ncbi:MAG: leucine--tRNA ligase [Patescibacteria group bacterium]
MAKYEPRDIEKKWQARWEEGKAFAADRRCQDSKGKYYLLDFFPYPSSNGLHVGHPKGYTATDVIARKRRMEGFDVLHPMGWDAFGLPAENYAIKMGGHPNAITADNIANFRRQIKSFGFSYDWDREVNSSSPEYYKWTQWLFLLFYKNGLAYKKLAPVNWCENDHTVLANEQVVDGKCERCKNPVVQKELSQWFFKITDYADRLLEGLDRIDWSDKVKAMQRNWIGRSEGIEIGFRGRLPDGGEFDLQVFTTRPDTLFGVTAVVVAPEHPLVDRITADSERGAVGAYVEDARRKTELERGSQEEKTGIFTGAYVKHPLTGADVPVYVADYVLMNYGTGAVMMVPAHDERDFSFAKTYDLPIKWVIAPPVGVAHDRSEAYAEAGILVNSGEFDGLTSNDAKQKIADALEAAGKGRRQVNYHLRDWLVSRQRYWGAPIPIVYCDEHGEQPVPEDQLPVVLPEDVDFRPTGESPLARSESFHDVKCPTCGRKARRESDTMDTFVDSSWYFLRYIDPKNDAEFASREAIEKWCPVDLYVGGAEHAVLHLLYFRFFTKVLHELGYLDFDEPALKFRDVGLIQGEDGEKMSKSRGNVVNPDDVVGEHGADVFRLYEMFMGEFEQPAPWNTKSIIGQRRFVEKAWKLAETCKTMYAANAANPAPTPGPLRRSLHKTIRKVGDDIENFKFNTAISAMMIFVNEVADAGRGDEGYLERKDLESFLKLLSPFAPHVVEEMWEALGNSGFAMHAPWPAYDPALIVDSEVEIALQVTGKVKDRIIVAADADDKELERLALQNENVKAALEGKTVKQVVVVKRRLVNIVAA